MDTSASRTITDKTGRRTGPRRRYTTAEKRAIVEETRQRGASVASVAQQHGINANLLFGWRRLHQQGLLEPDDAATAAPLVPVRISTPTVVAAKSPPTVPKARQRRASSGGAIDIEFAGGIRVRVQGDVDRTTLARVIDVLSSR
jgi:transposase